MGRKSILSVSNLSPVPAAVVLLVVLAPLTCVAQDAPSVSPAKTAVALTCTCTDQVGQLYASALRDVIARSPRYRLALSPVGGTKRNPIYHYNIVVVSTDDSINNAGQSTALSVSFLIGSSIFLDSEVQVCGMYRVKYCARQTLAGLDSVIHQ